MPSLTHLRELDRSQWAAVTASFLGWTLDAFDFFLMVFMFGAIAKEFHTDVAAVAIASTLTLAARPFGALVFGMLADRYGRRPVMMVDILLYSVLEFASAFAPSLTVLLILRAAFGFAMGGEWGIGACAWQLESIPPKARGVVSGLLQEGLRPPAICWPPWSMACCSTGSGWRGMFVVGVAPALLVVLLRLGVEGIAGVRGRPPLGEEAQPLVLLGMGAAALAVAMGPALVGALDKTAMLKWVYFVACAAGPVRPVGVHGKHWKIALYVVALMTAFNVFSHGTQDLYPTFLQKPHLLDTGMVRNLTVIMNIGAVVGGLVFGAWSEVIGRRRADRDRGPGVAADAAAVGLLPHHRLAGARRLSDAGDGPGRPGASSPCI